MYEWIDHYEGSIEWATYLYTRPEGRERVLITREHRKPFFLTCHYLRKDPARRGSTQDRL